MTKFGELCTAYGKAKEQFDIYNRDCHIFAQEIVRNLKDYFQVPESQFTLYRVAGENRFELVPPAVAHAIEFRDDNYWHFGVGLTVCQAPETLPEELILIHLMFRKTSKEEHFIKYAFEEKEFQVQRGVPESYHAFCDFLFDVIMTSYQKSLQRFYGDKTERKLGYLQ